MHPGGSDILMRYLGREATEFKEWHELEVLDRYPDLRVGRIVPELSMDEVSVRHVVIHGWIFDVSSLAPEHSSRPEDHWMYTGTYQFRGGDASEAIRYPNTDMAAALRQLFVDGKEHIVGRLREDKELPSIPSGELKRHNDPESTRGAWTVVGELVYDVTCKSPVCWWGGEWPPSLIANVQPRALCSHNALPSAVLRERYPSYLGRDESG